MGCELDRSVGPEQKRQALALVLHSETFSRSDQLKRFLRYICEMEESGRVAEITEYSIGTHALGRPIDYSPTDDSTVRGRAHALRQKLQQFYQQERPDAPVRIGLRKGSYTPYFFEYEAPAAQDPPPAPVEIAPPRPVEALAPPARKRVISLRSLVGVGAVLALAVAGRSLIFSPARPDAILKEFWGPLLRSGSEVLLCVASPPALLIKPFPDSPRSDFFQPVPQRTAEWYASLHFTQGGQPFMYHSTEAPLFGDAAAAVKATQAITSHGGSFQFLPETILGPAALRNRNVLLIGAPNYSPYSARVLRSTPFTILESETAGEEVIRDRSAKPGVTAEFVPKRGPSHDLNVVYGLITVFPNQNAAEDGPRAVIISGLTGAGAQAAMEFFCSPACLTTLRTAFATQGLKRVPPSYQVVVRSSRDRAVPLTWDLQAVKVMEHPPTLE